MLDEETVEGETVQRCFVVALSCNRNCSYSHYSCEIARSRIRLPRHEIRAEQRAAIKKQPLNDSFIRNVCTYVIDLSRYIFHMTKRAM